MWYPVSWSLVCRENELPTPSARCLWHWADRGKPHQQSGRDPPSIPSSRAPARSERYPYNVWSRINSKIPEHPRIPEIPKDRENPRISEHLRIPENPPILLISSIPENQRLAKNPRIHEQLIILAHLRIPEHPRIPAIPKKIG